MTREPQQLDPLELAELYAVGGLEESERIFFESRLKAGDTAYITPWKTVRSVAEQLLDSAPELQPAPASWEKIEAVLGEVSAPPAFASVDPDAAPDPIADAHEEIIILRGPDVEWSNTEVEGVQTRNLFLDREHNRLTLLVRMAPGASYTDHDHDGIEECMVIEGDLRIAGTILHGGDYLRTPIGARHGVPSTENGCLLLVTTPFESTAA